jgi:transposase
MGIKSIARRLGVSKNTVRRAVRSHDAPRYERMRKPSVVDPFVPRIHELLKATPTMPATVIAERIGWERGITILKERVAEIRPLYRPPKPYQRTSYEPGELAQWDLWQPDVEVPIGYGRTAKLWVIVGVCGYSRWMVAHMIPSRQTHDVLGGHLRCLIDLGAVPRTGVYDNEGAIGRKVKGEDRLTEEFQRFRGILGMGALLLRGGHPEGKGLVERDNGYLETSFLPGRSFADPDDFNRQLKGWLHRANHRHHRTLECRPADRFAEDRAAMLPLPKVLPDAALHQAVRLGRDHYVRVGACDYSVDPRAIGRRVDVSADLEWVVVRLGDREIARHRRSLVPHRTITDPAHARARRALIEQPQEIAHEIDVEVRDLAVYDALAEVAG